MQMFDIGKELQKAYGEGYVRGVEDFAERLTEHSSFCVTKSDGKELYETKAYTIRAKIIDELVMEMTEKEGGKV